MPILEKKGLTGGACSSIRSPNATGGEGKGREGKREVASVVGHRAARPRRRGLLQLPLPSVPSISVSLPLLPYSPFSFLLGQRGGIRGTREVGDRLPGLGGYRARLSNSLFDSRPVRVQFRQPHHQGKAQTDK